MKVVLPILSTLFLVLQGVAVASVHFVQSTEPDHDRWMYPFNGTPGARAVGSTFTAYGSEYDFFDDRDGQMLLGFMTGESVPMGHGPSSYQVISATVSIMIESDFIIYDPTADGWETYLEGGPADADAGRATVISGAGFRGGYDGWSFNETGLHGPIEVEGRNVYPVDFTPDGIARDISNNITHGFDPSVFGTAHTDEVTPGEIMPMLTRLVLELDVADPDIQCYLRTAVDDGLLSLVMTSMHPAEEPGQGGGVYPDWIAKENSLVAFGFAEAAGLQLEVELVEPSGVDADVDADGLVAVSDLLRVISDWGRCPCCPSDIDGNGHVDVTDLLAVIANWGGV